MTLSMSRIPPALLFLTVFNPTLLPTGEYNEEDEDAEEQAHVLFYTARERAVSRGKILRQVGLAKALINFSGMFNSSTICENVHSQSRRMVMVSPEPDFWIHACVELAKTPRQVTPKRSTPKSKGKEPVGKPEVVYDYHDGSVRDFALRTHILRGYELFKLTHGSFTSILSSLGQQALELQLERFFTVWAWKWDTEEDITFASHLGVPLHPLYHTLTPILDEFTSQLPYSTTSFIFSGSQLVPSASLSVLPCAGTLSGHIATRIPPPPPPIPLSEASSSTATVVPPDLGKDGQSDTVKGSDKSSEANKVPFMNHVSHMSLDMKNIKWGWPGYLTFGKTKPGTPSIPTTSLEEAISSPPASPKLAKLNVEESKDAGHLTPPSVNVDTESLVDAISSDNAHSTQPSSPASRSHASPSPAPGHLSLHDEAAEDNVIAEGTADSAQEAEKLEEGLPEDDAPQNPLGSQQGDGEKAEDDLANDPVPDEEISEQATEPSPPPPPPPQYLPTTVFLEDGDAPASTRKMRVWHATRDHLTLALVVDFDHPREELPTAADYARLLHDVEQAIEAGESKNLEASIPTVTKILEPQDKHVISTGQFTLSSSFTSRSEHFFSGQQILRSDLDAQEVFSRGQNPQHWYISRSGLCGDNMGGRIEGEAYMEIARKESTLTDVDNALAGVVRRFGES
ncbi:hypothetical protein EUX98_g8430 [Antrodiella citrinella]|uniref:CCZ1/INTU/HSP4 first Longin domain-containing protein n=1 Tax=Antrodiella citrinella TaxID=2447956 RepID=A0A4S4M7V0_9APHY|nr:hypothetical protein EUX98_g8430 [Antrodiella citrinella]